MSRTKIQFSKDELVLVKNSAWILTKNSVIEKLVLAFGELSEDMEKMMKVSTLQFADIIQQVAPKISRGEKYLGLPYLVLDYPRIFSRDNMLAIRTFFWWGRHCSISLHCSGRFMKVVAEGILKNYGLFRGMGYYIAISGDQWVHDLQSDPHQQLRVVDENSLRAILETARFIRLGKLIGLDQWEIMREGLYTGFTELLRTIESSTV